jgi:hypothetical protein
MAQRYDDDDQRMRSDRSDRDDDRGMQGGRARSREQQWGGPAGRGHEDDDRGGQRRASHWSGEEDDYGTSRGRWPHGGRSTLGDQGRGFGEREDEQGGRGYGPSAGGFYAGQGQYGERSGWQSGQGAHGRGDYGQGYGQGGYGQGQPGFGQGGYGQGGYSQGGSGMSQGQHDGHEDHHYRSWRERQLQAYDDEFKAFNEERQKKFDSEFEEWRKKRSSGGTDQGGSGQSGSGQTASGQGGSGRTGESGGQPEGSSSKKT